ncbi:hypothetical protein BJY52DRAFT_1379223 [Lactarius psammicola]|nr:hypothetical protein BJY52DRAFT_1379223 [Lactarius psammicola]
MALLTSALANATAPLVEALEAAEHERLLTENPTPTTEHSRTSSESHTRPSSFHQHQYQQRQARRASLHVTFFAPLPSHLSRFAAHVDALTNALHDAREHLESCVASLRDGTSTTSGSPQDAPALRAYERLRRELGLALCECERGREPLLELLLPPRALSPDEDEDKEVTALGPDAESSDSDKDASSHAALSLPSSPTHAVLVEARPPGNEEEDEEEDGAAHDRQGGVLVVGLECLPAPGIEQVFEADAGADVDAAFALSRDLGTIQATQDPIVWVLGYATDPVINYTDLSGTPPQKRSSFYKIQYSNDVSLIIDFMNDFANASSRAQQLDRNILQEAAPISGLLGDLVSLATAQVYGSTLLTVAIDTSGEFNKSDVMAFMRKVDGSEARVNPVETLYSAFPAFMYIDPDLGGLFLEPLFRLQASPKYTNPYAAPDLGGSMNRRDYIRSTDYRERKGTSYPDVTVSTANSRGVEDSGNMLIMTYAHARASGDGSLISGYVRPTHADMDADGPRLLARPRLKLSCAERIAAAKARRATGGLGLSPPLAVLAHAAMRGFTTLLDAAALAPTTPIDLTSTPVNAVAVSFYKMFGFPTGIGALVLAPGIGAWLREKRPWFAGGTVDVVQVPGLAVGRTAAIDKAFETLEDLRWPRSGSPAEPANIIISPRGPRTQPVIQPSKQAHPDGLRDEFVQLQRRVNELEGARAHRNFSGCKPPSHFQNGPRIEIMGNCRTSRVGPPYRLGENRPNTLVKPIGPERLMGKTAERNGWAKCDSWEVQPTV